VLALAGAAMADTHEDTPFSRAGRLARRLHAGARALHAAVIRTSKFPIWDSPKADPALRGAGSRPTRFKCFCVNRPTSARRLKPLGRVLNGPRIEPHAQALFDTMPTRSDNASMVTRFLNDPTERADAGVVTGLATGKPRPSIQESCRSNASWVKAFRCGQAGSSVAMMSSSMDRDPNHATGHYGSDAWPGAPRPRRDDSLQARSR